MGRKKVKLRLISEESTRKTTFRKRKAGLFKKANELTTLCGVEGCVIIHGPNDPEPEVWPSVEEAEHALSRFKGLPEDKRTKNMMNHDEGRRDNNNMVKGGMRRAREVELDMLLGHILEVEGDCDRLIDMMSLTEMKDLYKYLDNRVEEEIPDGDDEEDQPDAARPSTHAISSDDDDEDYVEEETSMSDD